MSKLTLDQAATIIDVALKTAREKNLKPLAVAVLDDGGQLKVFKKEDSPHLAKFDIAFGKAYGALAMGKSSRGITEMAKERPAFVNALIGATGGRVIPSPGGVIFRDAAGEVMGAIGVSGDTPDNDEACAVAGIKAAGFVPDL